MGLALQKGVKKTFNELLLILLDITRKISEIDTRPTKEAFFSMALKASGKSRAEIETLRFKIMADPNRFPRVWSFINRCVKSLLPHCATPPGDIRRFRPYGLEDALTESGGVADAFGLLAVAVLEYVEANPDSFGSCTDPSAAAMRLKALLEEKGRLLSQIETSWGHSDLQIDSIGADGLGRISLKITGGEVALGPSLGERTLAWMLQHPDVESALRKDDAERPIIRSVKNLFRMEGAPLPGMPQPMAREG